MSSDICCTICTIAFWLYRSVDSKSFDICNLYGSFLVYLLGVRGVLCQMPYYSRCSKHTPLDYVSKNYLTIFISQLPSKILTSSKNTDWNLILSTPFRLSLTLDKFNSKASKLNGTFCHKGAGDYVPYQLCGKRFIISWLWMSKGCK